MAALALLAACSVGGAGATPRGATIALELVVRRDKRSSEACGCQAPRRALQAVQETSIFLTYGSERKLDASTDVRGAQMAALAKLAFGGVRTSRQQKQQQTSKTNAALP